MAALSGHAACGGAVEGIAGEAVALLAGRAAGGGAGGKGKRTDYIMMAGKKIRQRHHNCNYLYLYSLRLAIVLVSKEYHAFHLSKKSDVALKLMKREVLVVS